MRNQEFRDMITDELVMLSLLANIEIKEEALVFKIRVNSRPFIKIVEKKRISNNFSYILYVGHDVSPTLETMNVEYMMKDIKKLIELEVMKIG